MFTLLASTIAFIISILLLQQVMQTGTISYELGGWSPPWGIEYRIDKLNAFIALIISGVSTVVLVAALLTLVVLIDAAGRVDQCRRRGNGTATVL